VLQRHGVEHTIDWTLGGSPFLTRPGTSAKRSRDAIEAECGIEPVLSTTGGTSDGRFIAHLPAGGRVRPDQRQHPQGRRMRRVADIDAAEEHLPAHAGALLA
jgi:acetylornithine deacetylase/succinyl-diaminopimelate desuccinylase-like protein